MILKTVTAFALRLNRQTDGPERPLMVDPPCQSDIKRTLRHDRRAVEEREFADFFATRATLIRCKW